MNNELTDVTGSSIFFSMYLPRYYFDRRDSREAIITTSHCMYLVCNNRVHNFLNEVQPPFDIERDLILL